MIGVLYVLDACCCWLDMLRSTLVNCCSQLLLFGLTNIESQVWPECLHFFDGHLPHRVILFIDVLLCNLLSIRAPSLQLADGSSQHEVLASVVDYV